jgi:hypothetical protein
MEDAYKPAQFGSVFEAICGIGWIAAKLKCHRRCIGSGGTSLMTALTTERAEGQMVGFRVVLVFSVAICLSAYTSTSVPARGGAFVDERHGVAGGEGGRVRTPNA